jgi:hypothetical protein
MVAKLDRKSASLDAELTERIRILTEGRQELVAERFSRRIKQGQVWKWANGTAIRASDAVRLAEALYVNVEWLMTGKDQHPPSRVDLNMSWLQRAIQIVETAGEGLHYEPAFKAAMILRVYELLVIGYGELAPEEERKIVAQFKAA